MATGWIILMWPSQKKNLVITGNLFSTSGGSFDQAIILMMSKAAGYSSSTLTYTYWHNPTDYKSNSGFSVYPLNYGPYGSYGPGALLVSTDAASEYV